MADLIDRQAALTALSLNAWKHEGDDDYSRGMDAGAVHQSKQDYAAIAALPAQGVRVKPLEWAHQVRNPSGDLELRTQEDGRAEFFTHCGLYTIRDRGTTEAPMYVLRRLAAHILASPKLPELYTAAQADYERRILAALAPAEAGGVELAQVSCELAQVGSAEAGRVEVQPVAWRQEDRTHPGWYYYGDAATQPVPADAQPLYASPAPVDAMAQAAEEVLRISDRDHEAWHRLRAALAAYRGQTGKEVMPNVAEGSEAGHGVVYDTTGPGVTAGAVDAMFAAHRKDAK